MHFSEIIKLQFGIGRHTLLCILKLFTNIVDYLRKMRGYPHFSFWISITLVICAKMLLKTYFTIFAYRFNHHSTYSYSGIWSIERVLSLIEGIKILIPYGYSSHEKLNKYLVY